MVTKICTNCKEEKNIDCFRAEICNLRKGHIIAQCRGCERSRARERLANKKYPNIKDRVIADLPNEVWVDVDEEGFEGIYQVSNKGRVKARPAYNRKVEKLLKPMKREYMVMIFCLNKVQKCFYQHRLIAKAFIQNPENKPFINHKNSNKHDNRIENLEWCTQKENVAHANENNLLQRGEKRYNNVLKEKDVLEIFNSDKKSKDLSREFGVSQRHVNSIKRGRIWSWLTHNQDKYERV